jgi:hypothetical protein
MKAQAIMKDCWKFTSVAEIERFWRGVCSVPGRTQGRKHYQQERYSLGLYLLALAEHELLTYPIQVEQSRQHESPDFMLTWPSGELTGLEVTRATEQWVQRAMTASEKEHGRRTVEVAASGEEAKPVCIPLSNAGWVDDKAEVEWCSLIRKAIEQKLPKLPKFGPASRHDLLVYDDTPLPAVDRRRVLSAISPWTRRLNEKSPAFGKISVIISLDVLFDLGGACRIFPYIDWSVPELDDPKDLRAFSSRVEDAGRIAVDRAVGRHTGMQKPIYFNHSRDKIVKLTPTGRRFEVRLREDGEEIVTELPHG